MRLSDIRAGFPHAERMVYVNHAAIAPLSTPVRNAIHRYIADRHVGAIETFESFEPVLEETRAMIGRLIGAPSRLIEFAPNTSYALNVLAHGLDWKPGDRIAIPGCEFPANVYPFMHLQSRGVQVDFVPHREGTFDSDDVFKTLTDRTRILSVSWVQFLSGFCADLAALGDICRDRGIIFCVDAIQGLGALKFGSVTELGIDFLASGCHKWLMGLEGLGFLYVSERILNEIEPPMAGWLHGPIDWDDFLNYHLRFHEDATRFRLGTLNLPGIAALHAAIEQYFAVGFEQCHQTVLSRAGELRRGFIESGHSVFGSLEPERGSGIVTIRHEDAETLHGHLQKNNIIASLRNGMVRFAPTWYNSAGEMEEIVACVDSV